MSLSLCIVRFRTLCWTASFKSGGCTQLKKVSHERLSFTKTSCPSNQKPDQKSNLGFLNSNASKKTHPNLASCVPSPSFPWGNQMLRLKLYMAFALSHVQLNFRSARSRRRGEGSATAIRWSSSRLNRPHDRRFRVLGPYDPPTSLIQGPPSPHHHHHHQCLLDDKAYRLRGEQNAACDGGARATVRAKTQSRKGCNARKANLLFLLLF